MAAPLLSKNKKGACLAKAVESSKKMKLKNVLCGESKSWPKPSRDVEESILLHLTDVLRKSPNIFKPVKNASKGDQEAKRKIRAQLDLGTNSVCRALEKDRLACVLVSGKVKPPAAIDHVVSVAVERGCPLLCLDDLGTSLSKATKSKTVPVCIGFKKLAVNSGSDFVDVITLIKENTSFSKKPFILKSSNKYKKVVKTTFLPDSLRPVTLDLHTDSVVCQELKRIFASAAINEHVDVKLSHRDRKRNKNKKKKVKQYYRKWLHNQFESGKKTVTDFVGLGKIQVVLVIKELLPVLMSEHPSSSLLCVARDMNCPVLVLSSLTMLKNSDTAKAMAVLGIKKETALPENKQSAFTPVIEACINFMRIAPMPSQEMDIGDVKDESMNNDERKEETGGPIGEDYSFLYVSKTESTEYRDRQIKLESEEESKSKNMTFASDFISLGGIGTTGDSSSNVNSSILGKRKNVTKPLLATRLKPKKMNTTTSSMEVEESSSQSQPSPGGSGFISFGDDNNPGTGFSISRGGERGSGKNSEKDNNDNNSSSSSVFGGRGVLGLSSSGGDDNSKLIVDKESQHVANVFDATARKSKGEDKKRHGQEGFVSFAYTEANIHTMVADSSKKKKK